MFKLKTFLIPLILINSLLSCGYEPIFSKKNIVFNINNIEFTGDKIIKQKINEKLSSYKNNPNKKKQINLILNSTKNIIIALRNSKGEAQSYKIIITVEMKAIIENKNFIEKIFSKSAIYNAEERESNLKSTEDRLVSNLSTQIANEIILNLLEEKNDN